MFLFICSLAFAAEVPFDWVSGFGVPANQVLEVSEGDMIKFEWSSGHNVEQMADETKFTGCDFSGSTMLGDTSPVTTAALTVGTHYYACSVGSHCAAGQKLAVTVVAAGSDDSGGDSGNSDDDRVACSESSACAGDCGFCNFDNGSDGFCEICDQGTIGCSSLDTVEGMAECGTVCGTEECSSMGPDCGADALNCVSSCTGEFPETCAGLQTIVDGCGSGCSQCLIDYYNTLFSCEGDDRVMVDSDSSAGIYSFFVLSLVALMLHF